MKEKLYKLLPEKTADEILEKGVENALEIRFRAGRKICIRYPERTEEISTAATVGLLNEILQKLCGNSLYVYADDMAKGFVTAGGWRVGIGGIYRDGIKTVSSLDIRISRQIKGCADRLIPYIKKGERIYDTLIASPPVCGKTTLLRDISRQLSDSGINISLIDERFELAAVGMDGQACFDVGKNTDIISGCRKSEGAVMALRSLAPQVIILDEIGTKDDMRAIFDAGSGGCGVICSAHCYDMDDLKNRRFISPLLGLFARIVLLRGRGEIFAVYNEKGDDIWQG